MTFANMGLRIGGRQLRPRARGGRLPLLSAVTAFVAIGGAQALAQQPPTPPNPPPVLLSGDVGNASLSATGAVSELSTKFLRDLANWAYVQRSGRVNVRIGGQAFADAPESANALAYAAAAPVRKAAEPADEVSSRYRVLLEGYGLHSRTDAQGTFPGDRRNTYGGLAGFGATVMQGVNVGALVDRGHTRIDIPGGQTGRIDLTQIGVNSAFEFGPWTLALGTSHGFADLASNRPDGPAIATTSYGARLWGAIAELSYSQTTGSWRVTPKAGVDWTRLALDGFAETGGVLPITGSPQTAERTRVFGTLDVGYTGTAGDTLYELTGYGRAIEIVSQQVSSFVASAPGAVSLLIPGIKDAPFEFDAGTSLSFRPSQSARLYVMYDARLRRDFRSHAGTVGLELRW